MLVYYNFQSHNVYIYYYDAGLRLKYITIRHDGETYDYDSAFSDLTGVRRMQGTYEEILEDTGDE